MCREARGGACVMYKEEVRAEAMEKLGTDQCVEVTGGAANTCKTCGAVIGGVSYCSQCNVDSNTASAPVDGQCTTENNECPQKSAGVCTQCDHASFMFKGGCYSKDAAPGNTMCTNAASGVCSTAEAGYFLPPTADRDASHQSVIPCGDDSVVMVKDDKKYKGVLHCTQCDTPDAATDTTNAKAATCTACEDGYFVAQTGVTCTPCEDDNCATCAATGKNQCSKCKATNTAGAKLYLKTESSSPTGTCVEASGCGLTAFPKDDPTNENKCASCSSASDGGIENCAECSLLPSASRAGAILITCTKCSKNNLSPLKNECMQNCPAGTYADSNKVCTPCHASCSSCSDAASTSCTACYPGHVLNKTDSLNTGACIPECTGRYAENCEAGMCTAVLGGSKYCSRCKSGYAPIDGLCTNVATTRRDASVCTASNGVCTACTGTYALLSGGCYNTKALLGMAVRTSRQ